MWLLVPLILYCLLAQKLFYRGGLAVSFVFVAFIIGLFITIVSDPLGDISFILLLTAGFFFMAHLHQQDVQFVERAAPQVLDFLEDLSHFCSDRQRYAYIIYMSNPSEITAGVLIHDAYIEKDCYNDWISQGLDGYDYLISMFDAGYQAKHPEQCMHLIVNGNVDHDNINSDISLIKGGSDVALKLLAKKIQEKYPQAFHQRNTDFGFSLTFRST